MLSAEEVLALIPHRSPFRFIDRILEIDDSSVFGEYTFRPDESFYEGHFPRNPVTPAAILMEAMAQIGLVALGLYLIEKEEGIEAARSMTSLFTEAEVEFTHVVRPGDTIRVRSNKVFWRRRKIRAKVTVVLTDGTLVAEGTLAGFAARGDQVD